MKNSCKIVSAVLFIVFLTSCGKLTSIQTKINDVDQILPQPKRIEKKDLPKQEDFDATKPIPLDVFRGGTVIGKASTHNPWYGRLSQWAKVYQKYAQDELDLRHFAFAQKYADQAILWANRAHSVKELQEEEALAKVYSWVEKMTMIPLPEYPAYFKGQDVYEILKNISEVFQSHEKVLSCYLLLNTQAFPALIRWEVATDLTLRQFYQRAFPIVQMAHSSLETKPFDAEGCHEILDKLNVPKKISQSVELIQSEKAVIPTKQFVLIQPKIDFTKATYPSRGLASKPLQVRNATSNISDTNKVLNPNNMRTSNAPQKKNSFFTLAPLVLVDCTFPGYRVGAVPVCKKYQKNHLI